MEKIKKMGLSLYKRFGFPEVKELGLNDMETAGEIYEIKLSRVTDREVSGHAVTLFNRQDLRKLPELGIGAVEFVITDDFKALLILHHPYGDEDF